MSIFDWLASLLAAFLIGRWAGITGYFKWILFFLVWTFAGVGIHLFFGVKTMLGYYLGLHTQPFREDCV